MPSSVFSERTISTQPGEIASEVVDLSVVIVNYNVREFLEQALRSVERASTGLTVEVFVVDNNSADASVEMVRDLFPQVHVIANEGNVGFGRANNEAIRRSRGRYLLILNPDTIVQENTLSTLTRFMDRHPEAGAAGCMILNPDGSFAPESRRSFPTPAVAFYRLTGLGRLFPRSPRFGRYNLSYLPPDVETEVDALSGSCMLVRREALALSRHEALERGGTSDLIPLDARSLEATNGAGLFDESFFMYGEDLDWCYRIQQAGWKILYTPATQIIHYKGESTKKGELRYVKLFYGAMLQFAEKHFSGRYSGLFVLLLRTGIFARATLSVIAGGLRRAAGPLLDAVIMWAVIIAVAWWRSAAEGATIGREFFTIIAPLYALFTVIGIAVAAGYRRVRRRRVRPVLFGVLLGLLAVSTLSFFVKDLAFSRLVVLAAAPLGTLILLLRRITRHRRRPGPRRAVLVGASTQAEALRRVLDSHPEPPFELIGFVGGAGGRRSRSGTVRHLAPMRQLRDVVRLHGIDEVIFAAADSSNQSVIDGMRSLHDLPLQFRILVEGTPRVIGKASVENLALPDLVEVDEPGYYRSRASHRAFDISAALVGLLLLPLVWLAGRYSPGWRRLAARLKDVNLVMKGRLSLVGYAHNESTDVPDGLDLLPGLFAVTESLPLKSSQSLRRSYAFYARNQSASLDVQIVLRSIRNLIRSTR